MKNDIITPFILLVLGASFLIINYYLSSYNLIVNIPSKEKISSSYLNEKYIEAFLISNIEKVVVYSVNKKLEDRLDVYIWDRYPKGCGRGPPTVEEVKRTIENEISSDIDIIVNKSKDLLETNLLELYKFYILKENNFKVDLKINEDLLDSGILDESFIINIKNLLYNFYSPFGKFSKIYEIDMNITPNRAFYLYRTVRDWINDGEFQRIVDKYSDKIFRCSSWSQTNYELCKYCIEQRARYIEHKNCDPHDVEVKGTQTVCVDCEKKEMKGSCVPQTTTVTCKTEINGNIQQQKILGFIGGGRGSSSSGGGGSGGGGGGPSPPPPPPPSYPPPSPPCPVECKTVECNTKIKCTPPSGCNVNVACPGPVACSPGIDENTVRNIVENYIIPEIIQSLESRFDEYVKCDAEIEYLSVIFYDSPNTHTEQGECYCGIAGATDSYVDVRIKVSCTDTKYSYILIDGNVKNNVLVFGLEINGYTKCPVGSVQPRECCDCQYTWECTVCEEKNGKEECWTETKTTTGKSPNSPGPNCSLKGIQCTCSNPPPAVYCEGKKGIVLCGIP